MNKFRTVLNQTTTGSRRGDQQAKIPVPPVVLSRPPGYLIPHPVESEIALFVREDEWGMKKYPRQCPVELRLAVWERNPVLLIALLVRIAQSNQSTFDHWINGGEPFGVRVLQKLIDQAQLDVHLVTDGVARSLRTKNTLGPVAERLVNELRNRDAWTAEAYNDARAPLAKLYPTAHALWWGTNDQPDWEPTLE